MTITNLCRALVLGCGLLPLWASGFALAATGDTSAASWSGGLAPRCDTAPECDDWGACQGFQLTDLLRRSDHCFDDFISPMTNPVWFEDPRTLTEARGIFLNHDMTDATGGGDVQVYALQLRLALTERLSLIAVKDGYVVSSNPLIDDGWADVAAGLKYNLIRDTERGRLLSAGLVYSMPVGSPRTLQGTARGLQDNADGEFAFYLTGGRRIGEHAHWLSAAGMKIPVDQQEQSTFAYWSNHLDLQLTKTFYALTELNWYSYLDDGNGPLNGVEGMDLFNFGSTGMDGQNLVTNAVGFKYKPCGNTEIGIAYEYPLTERRDIIDDRLTVDWIIRY